MNGTPRKKTFRSMRAKLIFNPVSGSADATPDLLMDIIREMQAVKLIPEAFIVEPGCDLPGVIHAAIEQGIHLIVACGGDGTITAVARALVGTHATLGIIPNGTQNNIALSLAIPNKIPDAVASLRSGHKIKVDVGMVSCGQSTTPFLEVCSVGLVSTIFSSVDDIQHGNLARVGEFLSTLAAAPPADIHMRLDGKLDMESLGHVVLVSNMPFIGFHYPLGAPDSYKDGLLDVLFFANLSKLELLNYVFQGVGMIEAEDPRIQHYHVRSVEILTNPEMPVMVDGNDLGTGLVRIKVWRHALSVMVGQASPTVIEEAMTDDTTHVSK